MIGLAAALIVAQLADMVWPRADSREGSLATLVVAGCLCALLAVYPTGKPVPKWTAAVAIVAWLLFVAGVVAGPDVTERAFWPLPFAVPLLALVVGGQGYRYVRRSSAAEREAVRWPLLGTLIPLTLVVPADLLAVALTGDTIGSAVPLLGAVVQLGMLLPGVGFLVGVIAPKNELVDRLLALWLTIVLAAAGLGIVVGVVYPLSGLIVPAPWPVWLAAASAVAVSVPLVPLLRGLSQRVFFRGRAKPARAVEVLNRRLQRTLEVADVPAEVAAAFAESTGSAAVELRRWGQQSTWAAAGAGSAGGAAEWTITHLGLPVATVRVAPRPGEAALASQDHRIIDALCAAAAPALHGARLAAAFPELTDRERQVLAGMVRGLPNSAIATRMGVSSKTVANYVSIVLTKLRVPDKQRAAELARRRSAEFS